MAYHTSERMDQIAERSKFISDSRGIGCMYSLEICDGTPEKIPSKEKAEQIQNGCLQDGLLMILSGEDGNVIRTHFPLSITDDDLEIGMSIIEKHLLE